MPDERAEGGVASAALKWLKRLGVDYASLMRRVLFVAAWILGACLLITLAGLFSRVPAWIPGAAIAVAGVTVTVILLLASPVLMPLEWLAGLQLAAPIRRSIRSRLAFLFWSLFAALFVALIPKDSDPVMKLLFVFVSILIAFGIAIKTIDINRDQIGRIATWKLLTLFLFLGFAVTFPRTGKAVLALRTRADRAAREALSGPLLPSEALFKELTCDQMPAVIWSRGGDTLVWFARTPEGGYELFTGGGHHPTRAVELTPVSSDSEVQGIRSYCDGVRARAAAATRTTADSMRAREESTQLAATQATKAAEAERRAREFDAQRTRERDAIKVDRERRDRYLVARRLPQKVEFVVVVSSESRQYMASLAAEIATELGRQGTLASSIVFSTEFVTSGAFDAFFAGRGAADIREIPLSAMGNRLLLVRVTTSKAAASTSAAGAFNATASAAFSVVSTTDGSVSDAFELSAVGAGVSERSAIQAAHDRLVKQMGQRKF
jgi:hypothetical protein